MDIKQRSPSRSWEIRAKHDPGLAQVQVKVKLSLGILFVGIVSDNTTKINTPETFNRDIVQTVWFN